MFMFFVLTTALLYSLSAGIQYLHLINQASSSMLFHKRTAKTLAIAAIAGHTLILRQSLHLDSGINLSLLSTGSLVSWLVALVLMISSSRQKVDTLFIGVLPMATLLLLLDALFSQPDPKPYATGVISHILLSVLSYSIFTLATFQAILLHQQNNALKRNISSGFLNSLPPLQTMERLLFEMLWTGFILLSAALVTGTIYVDNIVDQQLAHKTLLSLISWLIFAVLLFGRLFWGWRGHKAIRWTIGGFVSLMLGFFGSKLVLEVILNNPT